MAALDGDARLVLAQFSEINTAGHLDGVQFSGDSYDETKPYSLAIDSKVALLQRAVDKIDARSDVPTTLLVLSDHGHLDRGGAGGTSAAERDVPFLARRAGSWGAPLAGYELCPEETRMVDVAPTVAALLGLPVPRHSQGRLLLNLFVHNTTAVSAAGAERRLTAQQEQEERSVQDSVQEQQRAEAAEAAMSEYRRLSEGGSGDDIGGAGEDEGSGDAVASPPPPPHAAIITTEFTAAGDVGDYDDDKKGKIAEAFAAEAGVSVEAVSVTVEAGSVKITVEVHERRRRSRCRRDQASDEARRCGGGHRLPRGRRRHRRGDRLRPGGHQPLRSRAAAAAAARGGGGGGRGAAASVAPGAVAGQRRVLPAARLHPVLPHPRAQRRRRLQRPRQRRRHRRAHRREHVHELARAHAAHRRHLRRRPRRRRREPRAAQPDALGLLLGVWMVLALLVMQLQTHCDPLALLSCRSPADTPALRFSFLCVVLYYLFCVGIFLAVGAGGARAGAILRRNSRNSRNSSAAGARCRRRRAHWSSSIITCAKSRGFLLWAARPRRRRLLRRPQSAEGEVRGRPRTSSVTGVAGVLGLRGRRGVHADRPVLLDALLHAAHLDGLRDGIGDHGGAGDRLPAQPRCHHGGLAPSPPPRLPSLQFAFILPLIFYNKYIDDSRWESRFQLMTLHPSRSALT